MWGFTRKNNKNVIPSKENIAKTRLKYVTGSENATKTRAQASIGTSVAAVGVGSIWATTAGISAAHLAAASAVGASIAVPALAPAALGVIIACIFVMRQRGLNKELLSNLYFIKMEVERMSRIHNVLKVIAKENHINLNTASLSLVMVALQKKILMFADKRTKIDIQQLEQFLKDGNINEARELTGNADKESDSILRNVSQVAINMRSVGGGWLPTGWSSRWLSPDETLRQIVRDITIANVWFSIMLGEFDIFMRFFENKGNTQEWKKSKAMMELLIANKQLGLTTHINKSTDPDFDLFYNILDIKEATEAISSSMNNPIGNNTVKGGKHKKTKKRR